jgi:hypothetical protein
VAGVINIVTRPFTETTTGRFAIGDAPAKGFRWLHEGLHRLDFAPGFRRGPVWVAITLALFSLVTFGLGAGVWLGCRRLGHDLAQFGRIPR